LYDDLMPSKATTVEAYLAELPEDRRAVVEAVRAVVLEHLPEGYEEGMQYGMIGYYVPHRLYPAGYHCDPRQPLGVAALAAMKHHYGLYMMGIYTDPALAQWFREAWLATGNKLDMGKACVRFRKLEQVPLEVVGEAFARLPAQAFIERYEMMLQGTKTGRKAIAKKSAKSTSTATKKSAKSITKKKSASAKKTASAKRVVKKKVARTKVVKTKTVAKKVASQSASQRKATTSKRTANTKATKKSARQATTSVKKTATAKKRTAKKRTTKQSTARKSTTR
jgi:hypothetical protein